MAEEEREKKKTHISHVNLSFEVIIGGTAPLMPRVVEPSLSWSVFSMELRTISTMSGSSTSEMAQK
jgi:hypothetical protein